MNILFIHEVDLLNKVVFEIHNLAEILSKNHKVFAIDYEEKWKTLCHDAPRHRQESKCALREGQEFGIRY